VIFIMQVVMNKRGNVLSLEDYQSVADIYFEPVVFPQECQRRDIWLAYCVSSLWDVRVMRRLKPGFVSLQRGS
jgi:hypothetical protein